MRRADKVTVSSPAPRGPRNLQLVSRTVGEVLLTLGVLILLFVAYQLVWTNVMADRAARTHIDQLVEHWDQSTKQEFDRPLASGEPFALMYIPRLGADWKSPVLEGVNLTYLAEGVGHYPDTALPGDVGNFAVAGHRATNGEPFAYLDQVRKGDAVVVETATTWYTYLVTATEIVPPTQVDVLLPVPGEPGAKPTEKLMTLTTCNPRWASYQRLIVYGELEEEQPKADGRPPALQGS